MQIIRVTDQATAQTLNALASASADLQRAITQAQGDLIQYKAAPFRVGVYAPRLADVIALGAKIDALMDVVQATGATEDQVRLAREARANATDRTYFTAPTDD